jgi:hypothetical protein
MSPCPGLCDQRLREPVPTERVGETGPWSLRWKQKKTPLPTGEDSIHWPVRHQIQPWFVEMKKQEMEKKKGEKD